MKEKHISNRRKRITKIIAVVLLILLAYLVLGYLYSFKVISLPDRSAKELDEVPESYYETIDRDGTIERFDYQTGSLTKTAYIYLPYGYDENDVQTKYDIFYLMHGGGGSESGYLGTENDDRDLKRILDNMIANGDIQPTIVVTPTFYRSDDTRSEGELTKSFKNELVSELIPAVEQKYHTYAETTDYDGLKASRMHRSFGGVSMGSVTTWYTFMDCLDYFKFYLPMSGDCWSCGMLGGLDFPHAVTAASLNHAVSRQGYTSEDFYIYAATGTEDIAHNVLSAQMNSMKLHKKTFQFAEDFSHGNVHFDVANEYEHDYPAMMVYLYTGLRMFEAVK
ncbi:MAG: hypothetical protein IJ828_08940 [Treponema sp.]|nr:hypothetical protein [Treponema sp.]